MVDLDKTDALAALFAATPDLLEAAKQARNVIWEYAENRPDLLEVLSALRDAINAAQPTLTPA